MGVRGFVEKLFTSCYLGDLRRTYVASEIVDAISKSGSVVINKIAKDRAQQVKFHRFLDNDNFETDDLLEAAYKVTSESLAGSDHLLAIQDTTEVTLGRQEDLEKQEIGALRNRDNAGFYLHPVMILDPKDNYVHGISSAIDYSYQLPRRNVTRNSPVEMKKSYRWIESAENTKNNVPKGQKITFVGDRENDFYEFYARVPDETNEILIRSKKDKKVTITESGIRIKLEDVSSKTPYDGKLTINIRDRKPVDKGSITDKKKKKKLSREAELEIRFMSVTLRKPSHCKSEDPETLELYLVDVSENGYDGEDAIQWHLLTSHPVKTLEQALEIIEWYRKRWHIEQLFRSIKRQGLGLEQIELSKGESIKRMAMLALLSSIKILQLTLCRDGEIDREGTDLFSTQEIELLTVINSKVEGKTDRQLNPHREGTIAWCHWVIARLGGWKGPTKHGGPAGPKSIKRGLDKFSTYLEAWTLFALPNVCIT